MSAGTGISHSEFNASAVDPVHFLQVWIIPGQKSLEPSYEQRHFPETDGNNGGHHDQPGCSALCVLPQRSSHR
ncbi:MAG: pirin family protein [Stellaceae bacterium]